MAKQACDPYRCEAGQAVGFVRPGTAINKGDFVMRNPLEKDFVCSIIEAADVAAAITGFLGVAVNGVSVTDPNRRVVINLQGNYMYPLASAAAVNPGEYLTFTLTGGKPDPQKWVITATAGDKIAYVVKGAPPLEYAYRDMGTTPKVVSYSTNTLTITRNPFRVGDRIVFAKAGLAEGAVIWTSNTAYTAGTPYYVVYSSGNDIRLDDTANGTAASHAGTADTAVELWLMPTRGTATEAEGALISKLIPV